MSANPFNSFLRSLHRRLAIVRAFERAGVCTAIAAGIAIVLVAAMGSVGRDGLSFGLATVLLGAMIGLVWGLVQRPRVMDAAIEADRQLQLADLLSSALSSLRSDDPWSHAVVSLASARCRTLSPSEVIFHRYGARAWGGIGLSVMLVVTVGLMTTLPDVRRAEARGVSVASDRAIETSRAEQRRSSSEMRREGQATAAPSGAIEDVADSQRQSANARSTDRRNGSKMDGAGTGQTPDRYPAGLPFANATGTADQQGTVASGGGISSRQNGVPTADASAGLTGSSAPTPPAPPWKGSSWRTDRARALRAVQNGSIPDAYRDVVREYFDASTTAR